MRFLAHTRGRAVLLAFILTGAQWLLGRAPGAGSACAYGPCPAPAAGLGR